MKTQDSESPDQASPPGTRPARLPSEASSESTSKSGTASMSRKQNRENGDDARVDMELSEEDQRRYDSLKGRLHATEKERAKLLWKIKKDDLHRAEYESWEAFVGGELDTTDRKLKSAVRHANRHARWGRLLIILGPNGPTCEAHARPLGSVDDEDNVRQIWKEVQEQAEDLDTSISERLVRKARSRHFMEEVDDSSEEDSDENQNEPKSDRQPDPNGDSGEEGDDDSPDDDGSEEDTDTGSTGDKDRRTSSPFTEPDEGAFIHVDPDIARSAGVDLSMSGDDGRPVLLEEENVGQAQLREVIGEVSTVERPLPKSSGEDGIADAIWQPLVTSLTSFGGKLPEENDQQVAILKPGEIGRLSSSRAAAKGDRVLVCPGIDLFGPAVPDVFIAHVLDSLKGVEVHPIVFTRHLSRTVDFDLPAEVWLGTEADRPSLEGAETSLEAVSSSEVRWVLYDVAKVDREEGPSSFSEKLDWIVVDPPGGAGVSLTLDEAVALREAADDAGADCAFRHDFTTFSATYPA